MRFTPRLLLPLLLACASSAFSSADSWKPLFNGKDLAGWETWLAKPDASVDVPGLARGADGKYAEPVGLNRDPLGVFRVETLEGGPVLHVSGQIFGTLTTKETFANCHVRLQFKWGERRWAPRSDVVRDSGLLYRVHGPSGVSGGVWPPCIELQIQEHDVGDLWTVESRAFVTATPKSGDKFAVYDPSRPVLELWKWEGPNSSRCVKQADHEKPRGEWNTVELICVGEESLHVVNGQVVLRVKQARDFDGQKVLTSGAIALQSEGAEIFYRNVEVRPISEIPEEYR